MGDHYLHHSEYPSEGFDIISTQTQCWIQEFDKGGGGAGVVFTDIQLDV